MRRILLAVILFSLAASAEADFAAGVAAYARGDYAAAYREWKPLAEQGDVVAQFNLGLMYKNGEGVWPDYVEALRWYREAADQGYGMAHYSIGLMYANGEGVSKDYVQAYMWLTLAASWGYGIALTKRDYITARMTSQQIAEAQRLARVWRPGQAQPAAATTPEPAPSQRASPQIPRAPALPSDLVRQIQKALAGLGYKPGPVDGLAGARTQAAIRRFQSDMQLPQTGAVSAELLTLLQLALAARGAEATPDSEPKVSGTGSGFVVSAEGHVLTNAHVVEGCNAIRVNRARVTVEADPVATDEASDLALLRAPISGGAVAAWRSGRGIRQGDTVVVSGYPLAGVLTQHNITTGTVSASSGPQDDLRVFQITAPVQPGNSGGPALDTSGNVVGVVVGKLDAIKIARATGDIPQNVNFAIHAPVARILMDANRVEYEIAPSDQELPTADVAAKAREFTVRVECWR